MCYFAQEPHFFIYRIAAMVFGEECGRIASIFYALYIPNIFMSSVLTPESLAIFFILFCLLHTFLYKGLDHPYMWVFSAILFAFSNMIFPMGLFLPIFYHGICIINRSISISNETKGVTKDDRDTYSIL